MENNQSVQDQPSEVQAPTPKPEKRLTATIRSCIFALNLIAKHPWLLVAGLLGIFAGGAVIAVYSLGYVGYVESKEVGQTTVQTEVLQPTKTATTNPIPLWTVAAIALSCASGSLIIFRLLNYSKPHRKANKFQNNQTPVVRYLASQLKPPTAKNVSVIVPPQPQKPVVVPVAKKKKPVVTVLPPDQNQNLNQGQESLANMMDLRKQTPLSEIIRK